MQTKIDAERAAAELTLLKSDNVDPVRFGADEDGTVLLETRPFDNGRKELAADLGKGTVVTWWHLRPDVRASSLRERIGVMLPR
jgi:hypothetical protein